MVSLYFQSGLINEQGSLSKSNALLKVLQGEYVFKQIGYE